MLRENLYFEDVLYRLESLMVYSNIHNDEVMQALKAVSAIICYDPQLKGLNEKYYAFATKLLAKAEELGFSGHLLRQYSVYLFLTDKNQLSLACENGIDVKKSTMYQMALKDMGVLQYFMDFDLKNLCENVGYSEKIYDYTPARPKEYPEIEQLCTYRSAQELLEQFIWHYTNMGCERTADVSMFRLDDTGAMVGIRNSAEASFSGVYGYKRQIAELRANTEEFLAGKAANTLLLTGSRGIGKYTCLRALADQYFDKGLRLIEAGKADFRNLDRLLADLNGRNKKFIILADELTVGDVQDNYDLLKVCLGASMEMRPKNVLLYAVSSSGYPTEYFDEVVAFDELTEKEFQDLVADMAKRRKVAAPVDFLKEQALAWAADKHERSAKTAREYIKHVVWELKQK